MRCDAAGVQICSKSGLVSLFSTISEPFGVSTSLKIALSLFQRALQRVLGFFGEIHHLRDFGFGDFIGKYPANADTFLVDVKHHLGGLIGAHLKKCFQHMDDKFHWRIIVIEQQHFVEAGFFGFGARARGQTYARDIAAVITAIGIIFVRAHHKIH